MILEFGDYLPDLPDLGNEGCLQAKNCYAAKSSYLPLKDMVAYSQALTERPLMTARAKQSDGSTFMFAGTATKLHRLLSSLAWDDVSVAGGYSAERWDFTQFGDRVIAVEINSPVQSYVLGTSTDFANLIATLQAETVASNQDFVMVGNTFDSVDGNVPHRLRWCAFGDPTDWTVSATTQSDYQDLNSVYGEVKKVIFSDGAFYAFQEKAITRLQYVGSPTVFNVDTFETNKGTKYPQSVVAVGNRVFYISEDGFYMLQHSESIPIGADKVDEFFFDDIDISLTDRIRVAADPLRSLVFWAYPSNNGGGLLDKQLIFNWKNGKWTTAEYRATGIGQLVSLGYTLEDLDTITTDLDALSISLDSRAWQGGDLNLLIMDEDWKIAFPSGDTLAAEFTTAEFQPSKNEQTNLSELTALTDATCTLKVGTRDAQTDAVTWSDSYSPESNGKFKVREKNRYFRIQLTTSSDFEHVQGVEVNKYVKAGAR